MAKKVSKAAAKRGKKAKTVKKTKARATKKAKPAAKKKAKARKAKSESIGDRLSSGYHIVVDTVTGTERLRNKMEKPGTDETE